VTKTEKSILIAYFIQTNFITIFYKNKDIMGMTFSNRRILSAILVIILFVLVTFSQLGESSRPLQNDEWSREFKGLVLQLLPQGPSKPSSPDPIRP